MASADSGDAGQSRSRVLQIYRKWIEQMAHKNSTSASHTLNDEYVGLRAFCLFVDKIHDMFSGELRVIDMKEGWSTTSDDGL